jgi:hypothetical protein
MEPRRIDRLLMVCLVVNLILAFWWLSERFTFHQHLISKSL